MVRSASGIPNGSHVLGHLGRIEVASSGELRGHVDHALDGVTVHRRLVHHGRAGELGGAMADAVHLDVVGMPVVAVRVVHGEDVGRSSRRIAGEPLGGRVDGGLPELTPGSLFWSQPVIPESV